MDVGASAIAFSQAASACVKVGHELFQRYKAYKHSDERLVELILSTEVSWLKTVAQLEILNKIGTDLDSRLVEYFDASLVRLQVKLHTARTEIEILSNSDSGKISLDNISLGLTRWKKFRYAATEKQIRKTVSELKEWQSEFDPLWLLLIRSTSQQIDLVLAQRRTTPDVAVVATVRDIRFTIHCIENSQGNSHSSFKDNSFVSLTHTSLPWSDLKITTTSISSTSVLLDTTDYPPEADPDDVARHVQDLAHILTFGRPETLGLLQCLGVLKTQAPVNTPQQYQFIYALPTNLGQPSTLRHLLSQASVSLDAKYNLAQAMSRGVASVHAAGFVHKNIRPETILTFQEKYSSMPHAFLVGLQRFRRCRDGTTLTGDMDWYRNLYRHPQRQGRSPDQNYQMQHDIYSLGVCFLELGLWNSFVSYTSPPGPGSMLDISSELKMSNRRQAALSTKKKLLQLATDRLPALMGLVYTEIVVSCLTCLDPTASNMFSSEQDVIDSDGILVGVVFIEKILTRLLTIRLPG